jgi:hypothetical protein
MANRSAACDCTDLVVTFASRPGQIHKPIDVGEWHFPFSELKNASEFAKFHPPTCIYWPGMPATVNFKNG